MPRALAAVLPLLSLLAGACPPALDAAEPGYALHEWGVLTVGHGDPFAQQDLRAEWASFPAFFQRNSPLLQRPASTMVVRKPVVWIHASQPLHLALSVGFPKGRPMVWWPVGAADGERLSFDLDVATPAPGSPEEAAWTSARPAVPAGHWLTGLRAAPGSWLTMAGQAQRQPQPAAIPRETFIYYDGLVPSPPHPTANLTPARGVEVMFLRTAMEHELLDAILIERTDGAVTCSDWTSIAAGAAGTFVPMHPADAAKQDGIAKELQARLVRAGLDDAESTALLATWRAQLFAQDGLTLLYRMPQAAYEAMLPLSAQPAPTTCVRVGLVMHTHIEEGFDARVRALVDQLADPAQRTAATTALKALGGDAYEAMAEAATTAAPEVAAQIRTIIATTDLAPAMSAPGTRP